MTAALNYVVDPFGLWRAVEIRGFNAAKSERRNQAYLFKAADLRRDLPPALIVGSSRTAYGIDPAHPALQRLGGAYNSAFPCGNLMVIRRYLEFAFAMNPGKIKTVLFGLDFFDLNRTTFDQIPGSLSEKRLRTNRLPFRDLVETLLTFDATASSVATVYSNLSDANYQPL